VWTLKPCLLKRNENSGFLKGKLDVVGWLPLKSDQAIQDRWWANRSNVVKHLISELEGNLSFMPTQMAIPLHDGMQVS
jgi:hypothetical protein